MKAFEAIIRVTNTICVYINAEDSEKAYEIVEERYSEGEYDDMIAEAIGSYSETHEIDTVTEL